MSKKILFLILLVFLLTTLLLPNASIVSADSNCEITLIPSSLTRNTPPLSNSIPDSERWIQFMIQPRDATAKFKLVFPRIALQFDETRDNLYARSDGALLDPNGNGFPSLHYNPGDVLFKPERHTFYLEKKGSPGKYCEGSYEIKPDLSGGIQTCTLNFSPKPDETTNITVDGSVNPANEAYQLSITGTARKNIKLTVDSNGTIASATIGQLNPGSYTATLQKKGFETTGHPPITVEVYKDTNCQYKLDVTPTGSQGDASQIGNAGPLGAPPSPVSKKCGDKDKNGKEIICAKGGGQEAPGCTDAKYPNGSPNPGIATAIGCIHTNPAELTQDILKFAVGIGGGLAFLMMLLGAYQMLTSAGNPDTLKAGSDRLTNAVIGLLFIIFSVLLMQIIGAGILNIPGFK